MGNVSVAHISMSVSKNFVYVTHIFGQLPKIWVTPEIWVTLLKKTNCVRDFWCI